MEEVPLNAAIDRRAIHASERAFWSALSATGRVAYLGGDYYLTDRDDVLSALRDPALICPHTGSDTYPWVPTCVPNPAEHARYRSILNPWFTPRALASVTAAVQDHAVALVDAIADKGECDGGLVYMEYSAVDQHYQQSGRGHRQKSRDECPSRRKTHG